MAIAFPCAVAQTSVPLNGSTSLQEVRRVGSPRPPAATCRLGWGCSAASCKRENDRGSSYGSFRAVPHKTVSCPVRRQSGRSSYGSSARGSRSDVGSGDPNRASRIRHSLPHGIVVGDLPMELSAKIGSALSGYRCGIIDGDPVKLALGTMLCGRRNRALGSVASVGCKLGPAFGRAKRSSRRRLGRSCPRPHRLESRSLVRSRMWPRSGDTEGTGVVVKCGEAFPTLYPGKMKTHVCTFIFQRERGKRISSFHHSTR